MTSISTHGLLSHVATASARVHAPTEVAMGRERRGGWSGQRRNPEEDRANELHLDELAARQGSAVVVVLSLHLLHPFCMIAAGEELHLTPELSDALLKCVVCARPMDIRRWRGLYVVRPSYKRRVGKWGHVPPAGTQGTSQHDMIAGMRRHGLYDTREL